MRLVLSTFDGVSITSYNAKMPGTEPPNARANVLAIERVEDVPSFGGKSFSATEFEIVFTLRQSDANKNADIEAIGKLFDPRMKRGLKTLVALDTADSNKQYYIECTPTHFPRIVGQAMYVRMWTADPVWKTVTPATDSTSVTSSPTNDTITNNGTVDAYPTITVTPTSAGTNYLYRRHCIVYNPLTNLGQLNHPIEITNGGINLTSVVQADGDDIRVLVNGVEVERWLGGNPASDTTLKIWIVLDFPPGLNMTLQTALASSDETLITLKDTAANKTALNKIPDKGILLIDNEAIAYTAKNVTKRQFTIANSGRGIKDTTAATHSAGAIIRWIPFDIILIYGNSGAETPVQTDLHKPCFSLENSTNTNWRYDSADSVFGDIAGLRAGAWKPSKPKGEYSQWYTGNQGTVGTDPITSMGAEIVSYQSGSLWKTETANIFWSINVNAGITHVSSIGEKYKYASNTPFPTCRLHSSVNGVDWTVEWTETSPANADTWTSWTRASEAVPSGTKYVRFAFLGAVNATANAVARNEVDLGTSGSTGLTLNSSNVPQVTLVSQNNNAFLNFVLSNTTTGESFEYTFPGKTNVGLIFDTKLRTVTYEDKLLAPPELNTTRMEWFRLQPGANNVTYTDATTGNVTISWSWEERKNL